MNSRRFLTVTLKGTGAPLKLELDRLMTCWKRLRRTSLFSKNVVGGVYVIEVTWSEKLKAWHPHIHAIIDGNYIPQPDLKRQWEQITGDSWVVDIRQAHSARQLTNYLSAYVAKTGKPLKIPNERIPEYSLAIQQLRMMQTFGKLHGTKLKPDREPGTDKVEILISVNTLRLRALAGDEVAERLWSHWQRMIHGKPPPADYDLINRTRDYAEGKRPP